MMKQQRGRLTALIDSEKSKQSSFTVSGQRFVFQELGTFTLVTHAPSTIGAAVMAQIVSELKLLLVFFFGEYKTWERESLVLDGFRDVLDRVIEGAGTKLSHVLGGIQSVFLSAAVKEQLDRLVASLEEHEHIVGAMLLLGGSLLFSRLQFDETTAILRFAQTRSLEGCKLRVSPVYCAGAWHHLALMQMRSLTLAVLVAVHMPLMSLAPALDGFQDLLQDAALHLPVEEPPILLRHFTGHHTVAFLFRHLASNTTIAPQPRPGPASEAKKTFHAFLWFLSRARDIMEGGDIGSVCIERGRFRFHALADDAVQVYVLYSDTVKNEEMAACSQEIKRNCLRRM